MGYTDGSHDSPADRLNQLTRIGSKYQATAPAVADGDNVYLLLDASGRLKTAFTPNTFKMIDAVAIVAGTPTVVWTPASGKKVRLLGCFILSILETKRDGKSGRVYSVRKSPFDGVLFLGSKI